VDYESITDVILQLRYTAIDGGDTLKGIAFKALQEYIKDVTDLSQDAGLFAVFDLKYDYSNEWYNAMQPPTGATPRQMTLAKLYERLPVYTKSHRPDKIVANDVYVITPADLPLGLTLTRGTDPTPHPLSANGNGAKTFTAHDVGLTMDDWTLTIPDTTTPISK